MVSCQAVEERQTKAVFDPTTPELSRVTPNPHLVPPKRTMRSPTIQQHCLLRGHGPFPRGSTLAHTKVSAEGHRKGGTFRMNSAPFGTGTMTQNQAVDLKSSSESERKHTRLVKG